MRQRSTHVRVNAKRREIRAQAAELLTGPATDSGSVEELASSVGLHKPRPYHYFSSKDEILLGSTRSSWTC
jgi:AcrR family transcriptional regulator